jgi:hypothetical protein
MYDDNKAEEWTLQPAGRTQKDGVLNASAVTCEPLGATHYSPLSILENRQARSYAQQAHVLRNTMRL